MEIIILWKKSMNSFFSNALIFRSSRSQIFFKIGVLEKFRKFHRKTPTLRPATLLKRDSNTGVFLWNWRSFLWTASFTERLQWLLLWFLWQNNIIFSVITITLGYNQKLSWKYCNYYHPCLYKNIHLLSKVWPSSPNILWSSPPKSKLHDPIKHL